MTDSKYTVEFFVREKSHPISSSSLKADSFSTIIYTTVVAPSEEKAIIAAEYKINKSLPFLFHELYYKTSKKVVDID
jgi:hypothetical protein